MENKRLKCSVVILLSLLMAFMLMPATVMADEPEVMEYIDFYDLEFVEMFDYEAYINQPGNEHLLEEFLYTQHRMIVQADAVDAYAQMIEHFFVVVDGNLQLVYPYNYAGAYVDYDTLVIQLTCISDESTAFYRRLVGRGAPVVFKQVQFSFNELITFGEMFVDAMEIPVVSFGFSTMDNAYRIVLDQNDHMSHMLVDNMSAATRFMPVPVIFELGEKFEFTSLRGGEQLTGARTAFSVGLTGRRTSGGANALITTGHTFTSFDAGTTISRNGQAIGTVAMSTAGHVFNGSPGTSNGDWAIINLNAHGTSMMTNFIRTGDRITGSRGSGTIPVGTTVRGAGQFSAFSGVVINVNDSMNMPAPHSTISGLTSVNRTGSVQPVQGDSGGTIWSTPVTGTNLFEGVLAGRRGTDVWLFSPLRWAHPHFVIANS